MAKKSSLTPQEEAAMRQILFVPCETKEHLKNWIKMFLGIDLPDHTVCDDDVTVPPSNSNAMDLIWEVYQAARDGTDPKRTQYLYYAARDTWKSLTTTIIETLCLLHLDRDCAHLAAVKSQSVNVQRYLKNYFKRPILRDFLTSKNELTVEITRYEKDGRIISPLAWKALPEPEQKTWEPKVRFCQIIIATLSGTNSLHCSFVVADELDLCPRGPFEEAMMIPSPGQERGELPIVLMTSSRKFSYGLVQEHIDNAVERDIILRHWNLIDGTKKCPPERHRPDLPKLPIFYSEKLLRACSEEDFKELDPVKQKEYFKGEGYSGCLSNCTLFAQCKGRLATKQLSTSPLLKPIDSVQAVFKRTTLEKAKSQLMSWKPSNEGMIYSRLDMETHVISAAKAIEIMSGEEASGHVSKSAFLKYLNEHDANYVAGLDWGTSDPFGGALAARVDDKLFIFDAWEIVVDDLSQQIELCLRRLKKFNPNIYPDTNQPGMVKELKKYGLLARKWKKYAGSILDGIEIVRGLIQPVYGPPRLYFVIGDDFDPGVLLAYKRMASYHWKPDSEGNNTDVPDGVDDHVCDAIRYMAMNTFKAGSDGTSRHIYMAPDSPIAVPDPLIEEVRMYNPDTFLQDIIAQHTEGNIWGGDGTEGNNDVFLLTGRGNPSFRSMLTDEDD